MFLMNYMNGAWTDPRFVPYGEITRMPGAMCLHYGQTIFEGAKAFIHDDGAILLFRYDMNCEWLNPSGRNLFMPEIPFEDQMESALRWSALERAWVAAVPQSGLAVRPVLLLTPE